MIDQKKKIYKEKEHFTALLGKAKDEKTKQRIQAKLDGIESNLRQLQADEAPTARDGRSLAALPQTQTLYVAAELAHARALDAAGVPALWLVDPGLLASFEGTDIVLTEPALHGLAFDLGERFLAQCVNCWPQGQLDVVGTVPKQTHLLTLAETLDLVPLQDAPDGKRALAVYKAFGDGDEAKYRRMVRTLGAA